MEEINRVTTLEQSIALNEANLPIKNKYQYLNYLHKVDDEFVFKIGMPTIPAYTEDELLAYIPKVIHVPYLGSTTFTKPWDLRIKLVPGRTPDNDVHYVFYSSHGYSPIYEESGKTLLEALVKLVIRITKDYGSDGKYKL